MKNRTYRYFTGNALYPFGYGLSYTTFKYDDLKMPASIAKGKNIVATIRITNTGNFSGEEVAQLYISNQNKSIHAPIKALKGFQRIALKKGESKIVTFKLSADDLSLVGEDGKLYQPNGKIMISIGGGQPKVLNKTTSNVLSKVITVL
jgi:beta-glucosidase